MFFARLRDHAGGPLHLIVPDITSLNLWAVVIAAAAGVVLLRLHWNLFLVIALSALAGLIPGLAG